jgi:ATP-dependent exoDNAse (exonuclease V) alpha subunit
MSQEQLELTAEFLKAYELMESTKPCVFITGKAGTGKSTLLQYFKERTNKEVVFLAPTGVSALNIGGATIHSFFRFPPRLLSLEEIRIVAKKRRKLYQSLHTIVIDEISMVRADMIDIIDRFMRLNGNQSSRPFGGVQMIFIGDLFQLPPVIANDEETALLETRYQSPYFFSAHVFHGIEIERVELTQVFRQKDADFINLLNVLRDNSISNAQIQQFNHYCQPNFSAHPDELYITLTTTNQIANRINQQQLAKLPTTLLQFPGLINEKKDKKFEASALPTEKLLSLKKNAQVMFIKNDPDQRWVNGTLGKIKTLNKNDIIVETVDKLVYLVKPVRWEILEYQFDETKQRLVTQVIASFTQYPLRLAWAITIHKSQGQQFDKVIIDLGRGTFAHGQLYVALSRCKTLEGLVLKTQLRPKDVIVDQRVVEFIGNLINSSYTDIPF